MRSITWSLRASIHFLELAADDRHAHLVFRIAYVGDEAALKTRPEAFLEGWQGLWRTVGRDDDLFVILIERVEGVEEFFLCFFLSADELNIVNDQHVNVAIFFLYTFNAIVAESPHDVARELF